MLNEELPDSMDRDPRLAARGAEPDSRAAGGEPENLVKDLYQGLDLDRRSNFAQATAAFIVAVTGACIGYTQVKDERWLAALAGGVVGCVVGVFVTGFVLMVWPRPRITIQKAHANYERVHTRFVRLKWFTVAVCLLAYPVIGVLARVDATWAFVIGVLWFFAAISLCGYAKMVKSDVADYKTEIEMAERDG